MALSPEEARRALMAMHRFGLGAKPGGMTVALAKDPKGALRRETWDPQKLFVDDTKLPTTQVALAKHFDEQLAQRRAETASRDDRREMQHAKARMRQMDPAAGAGMMGAGMMGGGMMAGNMMGGGMEAPAMAASRPAQAAPQIEQVIFRDEAMARVAKGLEPDIGFGERLVLFWSNHFCASVQKGQINRATAGAMERESIRPHVFGKFSDMLLAVEKHPAMLTYLDNRQSIGPNSRAGRNRTAGLNENLAREILELHTLGVDGGYSQADVTSLAKIITGWTFVGPQERLGPAGTFVFTANRHEPGDQTVLGKTYRDTGVEQGETALRDIARHPATANHIARKLARHFVSDEPPPTLVAHLAKVFSDTDGDLAEVSRALVNHDDAWKGQLTKVRTPYEWLLAAARVLGPPKDFGQVIGPLNALGHPLWAVPGPNGFPDTAAHWGSPEGVRARLDFAAAIGRREGQRFDPRELAEQLFDTALSAESRQAIQRAETRQQGLAILLMSPEFIRR